MNLHLQKVISDITGLTGMAIIKAIVAGETDPQVLVALKDPWIKHSTTDCKALTETPPQWTSVCSKARIDSLFGLQQEIAALDTEIEKYLASFEAKTLDEPPIKRTPEKNQQQSP